MAKAGDSRRSERREENRNINENKQRTLETQTIYHMHSTHPNTQRVRRTFAHSQTHSKRGKLCFVYFDELLWRTSLYTQLLIQQNNIQQKNGAWTENNRRKKEIWKERKKIEGKKANNCQLFTNSVVRGKKGNYSEYYYHNIIFEPTLYSRGCAPVCVCLYIDGIQARTKYCLHFIHWWDPGTHRFILCLYILKVNRTVVLLLLLLVFIWKWKANVPCSIWISNVFVYFAPLLLCSNVVKSVFGRRTVNESFPYQQQRELNFDDTTST